MEIAVVLSLALTLLAFGAVASEAGRPVTRARMERFARLQRLVITRDNGERVIGYLAITRRWRASGLTLGALGGVLWSLPHGALTLSFTALFAGWFAGAVIAEWRVASAPPPGAHRSALLQPRLLADYLGPVARRLPVLSAALCAGLAVAALVGALGHDRGLVGPILAWTGTAAAGLAVITMIQRHVLMRPQPPAAPDVLAADDAIRSRSLQVLAGSAVAAAGFPTASLVSLLGRAFPTLDEQSAAAVSLLLVCAAALAGWQVAVAGSPVRRTVPSRYNDAVGGVTDR